MSDALDIQLVNGQMKIENQKYLIFQILFQATFVRT